MNAAVFRFTAIYVLQAIIAAMCGYAGLFAGAGKSNITPPIGTVINGGVQPVVSKYIHDELWAKAIVLSDTKTRIVFVVLDTCLVDNDLCNTAKNLIESKLKIPNDAVMISATHTHSGGSLCSAHLVEADEDYKRFVVTRIVDAVQNAIHNLAPATIGYGSTNIEKYLFCRRILIKPGMVYTNQLGLTNDLAKMNWDSPHPADDKPAGQIDPEFFVLSIKNTNGQHIAVLANYSLHYIGGVGSGHISADYFGMFAKRLTQLLNREEIDTPFVAILSNGTSGDINNINPTNRVQLPPYSQMKLVGYDLAETAVKLIGNFNYTDSVKLAYAVEQIKLSTRLPDKTDVEKAKAIVKERPASALRGWIENYAREQIILSQYPPEVTVPLQVFRIGNIAVACFPGEIFAETGLELKKRSPIKPIFNIGLANGWYGYIPPPEQFKYGAYETWRMRTSYLETNAIPRMLDTFVQMLEKLN